MAMENMFVSLFRTAHISQFPSCSGFKRKEMHISKLIYVDAAGVKDVRNKSVGMLGLHLLT